MKESGERKTDQLRRSLDCYLRLEEMGEQSPDVYDNLTEISHLLGEYQLFVTYTEKQFERYPGDRQQYNLGLAYSRIQNHQGVIESQKDAIAQYKLSPFVGGFYRLLGDSYFAIGRQQTAERTYEEGVDVVEGRLTTILENDPGAEATDEYRQLTESRRSMLLSLQKIYKIHGKDEKFQDADRRLNQKMF